MLRTVVANILAGRSFCTSATERYCYTKLASQPYYTTKNGLDSVESEGLWFGVKKQKKYHTGGNMWCYKKSWRARIREQIRYFSVTGFGKARSSQWKAQPKILFQPITARYPIAHGPTPPVLVADDHTSVESKRTFWYGHRKPKPSAGKLNFSTSKRSKVHRVNELKLVVLYIKSISWEPHHSLLNYAKLVW